MKTITITFTHKGNAHEFNKAFSPETFNTLEWIHECYKSLGIKAHKQVKNAQMTVSGWGFWAPYIA